VYLDTISVDALVAVPDFERLFTDLAVPVTACFHQCPRLGVKTTYVPFRHRSRLSGVLGADEGKCMARGQSLWDMNKTVGRECDGCEELRGGVKREPEWSRQAGREDGGD
jgi:hypothetical protein